MRRGPSFVPLFLFVLFLFHGAGLFFALRRLPRLPAGKAVLPLSMLALVGLVVFAGVLVAQYRRIRAGTTEAAVAVRRGVTLVVLGLAWGAASLAVVLDESTSVAAGLFALAGMVAWYPAVLAGAVSLLAVRR
jgi:hypothetical protein